MNFSSALYLYSAASVCGTAYALRDVQTGVSDQVLIYSILGSRGKLLLVANQIFNLVLLFGKFLQIMFFGKLRMGETQAVWASVTDYMLFKLVFLVYVIDSEIRDVAVWVCWFIIFGFLRSFSLLARERLDYLAMSFPATTRSRVNILALLSAILLTNLFWGLICGFVFVESDWSVLTLLLYECISLAIDTCKTLVKACVHLCEEQTHLFGRERQQNFLYYSDLIFDITAHVVALVHNIHILILHTLSLTPIGVLLFFNMRSVFGALVRRLNLHRLHCRMLRVIHTQLPNATPEQLAALSDEECAICKEPLTTGKVLPCSHVFHTNCLRDWLGRQRTCPVCRRNLEPDSQNQNQQQTQNQHHSPQHSTHTHQHDHAQQHQTHHEEGSEPRPVSEDLLRHTAEPGPSQSAETNSTDSSEHSHLSGFGVEFDRMVDQVLDIFPLVSREIIIHDLLRTHDQARTIENILSGAVSED